MQASASGGRLDVLGAVLGTAGITALVFGMVRTDRYAWGSAVTLAAALVLLVAFLHVEQNVVREPLIRLGLLTNRSVVGANAYNLLLGGAMASSFSFMSLYLQRVLGIGPALTGVQFLPFAIGVVVGSVIAIKLGARLSTRTLVMVGGLPTAVGFAWFSRSSATGSFAADILGPSVVASIGFGFCLGPVVSTATIGVAAHEAGSASGLLNSSRQIGASLGLAALGTAAATGPGRSSRPQRSPTAAPSACSLGAALLLGPSSSPLPLSRGSGRHRRSRRTTAESASLGYRRNSLIGAGSPQSSRRRRGPRQPGSLSREVTLGERARLGDAEVQALRTREPFPKPDRLLGEGVGLDAVTVWETRTRGLPPTARRSGAGGR